MNISLLRRPVYYIIFCMIAVGVIAFFHFQSTHFTLLKSGERVGDVKQEPVYNILDSFPRTVIETPFDPALEIIETSFIHTTKVCPITDYGAKADGVTKNTEAFAKAIDDCAKNGGGRVMVPAGKWLTGAIHLQSNIDLHLEENAEILFSTDFNDYLPAVFSRFEGVEYYNYSPPIYAKDCTNVAITGSGTIHGQAEKSWWRLEIMSPSIGALYTMGHNNIPVTERNFVATDKKLRPAFVEFVNCNVVLVDGITIINGPMWTVHPIYSENVVIRNVHIETAGGRSTDGVAVDSSRNVLIENSTLSTGDDAIVIKSGRDTDGIRVGKPSENIVVRNNDIIETHAGIAIGSEVSGSVRNVYVTNLKVGNATFGMRVKSAPGRQGKVDGIWVDNLSVRSASVSAVSLDNLYEKRKVTSEDIITPIRNIFLSHITAKAKGPLFIRGYGGDSIENIVIDGFDVFSNNDTSITDANDVTIKRFNLSFDKKTVPPIIIENSKNIRFEDSNITKDQIQCNACTYDITKTQQ